MKTIKTAVCALAVAGALVAGKAMASGGLVLNVSGTADLEKSYATGAKATTGTFSINEKFIYGMITNAVANASANSDGTIASTNLPSNGYIAFNPGGTNGGPENGVGYFYVTNKNGVYWPLSGYDANTNYYSFIELDSINDFFSYEGFNFGFNGSEYSNTNGYYIFNGVSSWSLNAKTTGSETDRSTGLLYIHDDPYAYDDANFPIMWYDNYNALTGLPQGGGDDTTEYGLNNNAVLIQGILEATIDIKTNNVSSESLSLTGPGNLTYQGAPIYPWGNLIQSAKATFSK